MLCSLTADAHEKEVLFPPLMGIEVVGTRVRSATLVVHAKVSLKEMEKWPGSPPSVAVLVIS